MKWPHYCSNVQYTYIIFMIKGSILNGYHRSKEKNSTQRIEIKELKYENRIYLSWHSASWMENPSLHHEQQSKPQMFTHSMMYQYMVNISNLITPFKLIWSKSQSTIAHLTRKIRCTQTITNWNMKDLLNDLE